MDRSFTERLAERLRKDPFTTVLSGVMADMAKELFLSVCVLPREFSAATAGTVGLSEWERLCGLTPKAGASLEDRRAAVMARLRANGTANAALIESMARVMTGYGAKVTEKFSEYIISLRFFGEPSGFIWLNVEQLRQTVELLKPAHLEFIIEPVTWADIHAAGLTWAQLEKQFPSWLALMTAYYIPAMPIVDTPRYLLIREIHEVKTISEMDQIPLNQFEGEKS